MLRVDFEGRKHKFGGRHNACPNSPTYRKYAPRLAEKLAERYKDHPALVAWHINNEYGGYCYCGNCAAAFRVWLQKRYGTLEKVNEVWNTRFWSHVLLDWEEILPPSALSEWWAPNKCDFQAIQLDYNRFQSESRERNKRSRPSNFLPAGWNETGRPVVLQVNAEPKGPGPHGRRRID